MLKNTDQVKADLIPGMREIAPTNMCYWGRDASGFAHWFASKPHAGDIAWLTRNAMLRAPSWKGVVKGSWHQTLIHFREAEESQDGLADTPITPRRALSLPLGYTPKKAMLVGSLEYDPEIYSMNIFAGQVRMLFNSAVTETVGQDVVWRTRQEILQQLPNHIGDVLMLWLHKGEGEKSMGTLQYSWI